jgi:flagellar hook-basal body complex protein FliE
MANMTIENIGGIVSGGGNLERIIDHGRSVEGPVAPGDQLQAEKAQGQPFLDMLKDSIDKANELQLAADRAARELAAGRNKNIHETMLMMEKADMSFRLVMQVRNKVIEAYREIMRMQV